ncbi:hypothetical protein BCR44DRAFT_40137 [Catenaria anguillulae PL171]|uniref:Histone H1 n=1 Tax=Catenaria anguillulae PL171 TaxID=765915 RepID=A0A1Y2HNH5_9FUNG|nr:hypothetical protein BCR44DRAFT_40137 [Catenaria anguillulae PL171]
MAAAHHESPPLHAPNATSTSTSTPCHAPEYVSYEEMILRALTHAQDHWVSSAKPFPGAEPKQIFAYMARHYAHLLPSNFKGSATQALKKAVKKGLVVHLYRAYALNPNYAGKVAPGRVKPNVWTSKLDVDQLSHQKSTRKSTNCNKGRIPKQVVDDTMVDVDSHSQLHGQSFRPLTPHSPLRLPDPIHFLSASVTSSSAASLAPESCAVPSYAAQSSTSTANDDTDLAAQVLMTFSTPPPPPPALPLGSSSQTVISDFGIPTPGIDSTCFAARPPVSVDFPGSCVRPPTSPMLYPSTTCSSAASTRCSSSSMNGSGPDLDLCAPSGTCMPMHIDLVLPPPMPLPVGGCHTQARSAADIVDSILFPHRTSASAVSEFGPDEHPPQLQSPSPLSHPTPLGHDSPNLTIASPFAPQARPPPAYQSCATPQQQGGSHPIAWLPVRLAPNGRLILPDGWSFIKPTQSPVAVAPVRVVNANGVGMIANERASSAVSSGSWSAADAGETRGAAKHSWWTKGAAGGGGGQYDGRRPGGMGL